jgi:hypothetical protein
VTTHDERVTPTPLRPQPGRPGIRDAAEASNSNVLTSDLERFWPSRRGHAFDELCR